MLKLKQVERDKRATCPIVPNKWLRQSLRHLVLNEHRAKSVRYLIYRHHEGGEFMDHVKISNLPIFWLLAGFTVFISALQAFLYIREAKKATKVCNVDPEIPKKAFKIGLISAIGPALGVFIIMVGLMSVIGGPIAWLRLSIIGAAPTELTAATYGAQACGLEGLSDPGYNIQVLAVSWFAMALNGAGWLLFTGVATPGLEKIRDKMSGGDMKWLAVMSASCSIGIFAYLVANLIIGKGGLSNLNIGNAYACFGGAIFMILLGKFVVPKVPKLAEYSLGIAMILGIAVAILFGK